jgi:hypothetical protein
MKYAWRSNAWLCFAMAEKPKGYDQDAIESQ